MTAEMSTGRFESTANLCEERGLLEANQTASAIKDRWRGGESPDVANALTNHPHLRNYRSIVLDLAYQEYRLRLQAGEELDAEACSQRFPSLQRSLHLLIEVHSLLSHDPDYQAIQGILPWPEPGSRFLQFVHEPSFGKIESSLLFFLGLLIHVLHPEMTLIELPRRL